MLVFMQLFRFPPHYLGWCGPIDLVARSPRQLKGLQSHMADRQPHEDAMTFPLLNQHRLALLLAATAAIAIGVSATQASAEQRKFDERGRPYYGTNGPNVVYQQGPHTRIYVTKRSWLDAGVEVLPGDRKFTDYAYPPGTSFARENNNRPIDRQPLNPPSDMGGYPRTFPLY
jgi:hypothetical protein